MNEYDPSSTTTLIGTATAALLAVGVAAREYLKREKLTDASRDSTVSGITANDKVLTNLVAEVARLTKRIEELEARVEHLTDKLANVRVIALDCYQIANECDCIGDNRARLLEHLKTIIRDA